MDQAKRGMSAGRIFAIVVVGGLGSCGGCMTLGVVGSQWGKSDVLAICKDATPGRDVASVERDAETRGARVSRLPAKPAATPPEPPQLLISKGPGRTYCFVKHEDGRVTGASTFFAG